MTRTSTRRTLVAFALSVSVSSCTREQALLANPAPGEGSSPHAATRAQHSSPVPGVLSVPPEGVRVRSTYSDIVVREAGSVRSLYFLDEKGQEHLESQMDVARPAKLMVPYTRAMFASYLFVPEPKRVLVIGVGAGSMLRFIERFDPAVHVEGVDIDPAVLDVARDYFGTKPSDTIELIAADGFDYLNQTEHRYDVIYLDAFLKPKDEEAQAAAGDTDVSGVPRRLKTIDTYKRMQQKLAPGGVVVINLHHQTLDQDVKTLREAFARGYLFDVPGTGNYVLVGTQSDEGVNAKALETRGAKVDKRLGIGFSLSEIGRRLRADE